MDADQINKTFDLIALAGQDTKLDRAGTYFSGPCPFCGGRDRFVIKPTQSGHRWFCRQCGEGKYHTPIDYVMRREHLDFRDAVAHMGGDVKGGYVKYKRREPVKKTPPSLPDQEWQSAAWKEVDAASDCLLSSQGQQGQDYLLKRGLHRGSWNAWHLGLDHIYDPKVKRKRPALVIPWSDFEPGKSILTAVKYRFIDKDPVGLRYISRKGSVPILYGLSDVIPEHHTLLLIEGEINALSIWQCLPSGVTCLSIGSETVSRPEILQALVSQYQNVIVWLDDAEKASKMRSFLGTSTRALQSPVIEGEKWDANKMLQRQLLADFLSQQLETECLGWMISTDQPANNSR